MFWQIFFLEKQCCIKAKSIKVKKLATIDSAKPATISYTAQDVPTFNEKKIRSISLSQIFIVLTFCEEPYVSV